MSDSTSSTSKLKLYISTTCKDFFPGQATDDSLRYNVLSYRCATDVYIYIIVTSVCLSAECQTRQQVKRRVSLSVLTTHRCYYCFVFFPITELYSSVENIAYCSETVLLGSKGIIKGTRQCYVSFSRGG